MKLIVILYLFLASVLSTDGCKKSFKTASTCFKGRLEIKAMCMNYTIKVLEGKFDTSKVANSWTDESTGKAYTNVFRLASVCSFPPEIREGETFYFAIDEAARAGNCAVCMAYYPTPQKELSIVVLKQPCP